MLLEEDQGPWFVRVIDSKVSVGIYACNVLELFDLVDEATEPDACEYKRLPPGGIVFAGAYVLDDQADEDAEEAPHMDGCDMTESWCEIYSADGPWYRIDAPLPDDD